MMQSSVLEEKKVISFKSSRFNIVTIEEDKVISINNGIIGFPGEKKYVMLEQIENTPFVWFHSVDNPATCFLVAEPSSFMKDYSFKLGKEDALELGVLDEKDLLFLVIVNIHNNVADMTANLKGPIVINTKKKLAKQVVLINYDFPTRYKIF